RRYVLSRAPLHVYTEWTDIPDSTLARVTFEVDALALAPHLEDADQALWGDPTDPPQRSDPEEDGASDAGEAARLRRAYLRRVTASLDEYVRAERPVGVQTRRAGDGDAEAEITFRVHGETFASIMDQRRVLGHE